MALEGNLQDMSLVDLLRIFHMGYKTGRLVLIKPEERGVVYVVAGKPIDSVLVRSADRKIMGVGEQAVLQLLQWDDAAFTFYHDTSLTQRPVRITRDSTSLMLEGLRRRDKPLALPTHQSITLDTRLELEPLPANAETSLGLDMHQWRLLGQIASSQTIRTFCGRTGMAADKALRTASELVATGLLSIDHEEQTARSFAPPRSAQQKQRQLASEVASVPTPAGSRPSERSLFNAILRRIREL